MTNKKLWEEFEKILDNHRDEISHAANFPAIAQLVALFDKHTKKYVKEILPKNPYSEPMGNPDLGFPDHDMGKRQGYAEALSDIRGKGK